MRSFCRCSAFGISLFSAVLLACPAMRAQKAARGVAPAGPVRTAAAGMQPATTHGASTASRASSTHPSHSPPSTNNKISWRPKAFESLLPAAPGPGFEFGFLNGANQGIGSASRRRDGRPQNSLGFGSGFYLLGAEGGYAAPADDSSAQPVADQQAADPSPDGAQDQLARREGLAAEVSASETQDSEAVPAAVQDEGAFMLILRDGNSISAVAFTHSGDKIIYISSDGRRLALPSADLDADATVRVNQERGTPLQLPL